ncbi:unnamed protein product [Euphydryas editha]|uniref:Uncharacterized protein n=1 Tax=Euphydryas editha TaxID=104508 RepID=A0AAU9V0C7_EUPED|nr:unnamed protein product [Euphydryas editha]
MMTLLRHHFHTLRSPARLPRIASIGEPPQKNSTTEPRSSVPGGPTIPGCGSGLGNGSAGSAKNLQKKIPYHPRRHLILLTHNIRTLRSDEKIVELEEEEINRL